MPINSPSCDYRNPKATVQARYALQQIFTHESDDPWLVIVTTCPLHFVIFIHELDENTPSSDGTYERAYTEHHWLDGDLDNHPTHVLK